MIVIVDNFEVLQRLCKGSGMWGMLLSYSGGDDFTSMEVRKAVPFLETENLGELVFRGNLFCLFDSKEACYTAYDQTVGDDGPIGTNTYNGPARVYAITCDPLGHLQNENT